MSKASRYTQLKKRLTEWRKEIDREPRRYPLKTIYATIAALRAEITDCLKERSP